MRSSKADAVFICKGYQNWKDATDVFRHHEASCTLKEDLHQVVVVPATHENIGFCFSSAMDEERKLNRICFMHVLKSILLLSRLGLPLRGDDSGESDRNYTQLLKLRASDDDNL